MMEKMFYGSAPMFLVPDVRKSVDYYCDVLGFDRPLMWGEPIFFAMPKRENIIIMLHSKGDIKSRNNQGFWDAYFWVKDAKSLFEEFKGKGANIVYEPELRESYGCLEFAIKDIDNNVLAFGQEYEGVPFFELNKLD